MLVRSLRGGRHALLPEELLRSIEVSVGILQGTLAVHESQAGALPESLHQSGHDLHEFLPGSS